MIPPFPLFLQIRIFIQFPCLLTILLLQLSLKTLGNWKIGMRAGGEGELANLQLSNKQVNHEIYFKYTLTMQTIQLSITKFSKCNKTGHWLLYIILAGACTRSYNLSLSVLECVKAYTSSCKTKGPRNECFVHFWMSKQHEAWHFLFYNAIIFYFAIYIYISDFQVVTQGPFAAHSVS